MSIEISRRFGGPGGDGEHFAYYRDSEKHYTESYALRSPSHTLVLSRLADPVFEAELYRAGDVGELRPILDDPGRKQAMLQRLRARMAERPAPTGDPVVLDPASRGQLRALGYVD